MAGATNRVSSSIPGQRQARILAAGAARDDDDRAAKTSPSRSCATRRRSPDDPLWYKDAVIYELHVRAFHDSNGDGIGDFAGLTAEARLPRRTSASPRIWLLPFYPSPLQDDGYDIADYTDVHPAYGTLRDFQAFLREAHRRGLRVITELVCNHTSDQHPWFQRARRAPPGSAVARLLRLERHARQVHARRGSSSRTSSARTGPGIRSPSSTTGTASTRHQPDLNFDNPRRPRGDVQARVDFWLEMGVDGLRLDACRTSTSARARTARTCPRRTRSCKRAARAHRRNVSRTACCWPRRTSGRRTRSRTSATATSATWPSTSRSCRGMFMALRMEDRFPIIDILEQTPPIPENVPVGAVPAQPRRADARDGHRRGARLHVPRLRRTTRRCGSTSASAAGWRRCSATTGGASS